MMFFNAYQYLAPLILLPVSYYLWWERLGNNHPLALLMLSIPVLFAYIIPAVGMNWLRVWGMNTRLKLGRFRPHHGFVFGSAISLCALLCVGPASPDFSWYGLAQAGLSITLRSSGIDDSKSFVALRACLISFIVQGL